jgi:signal transduction histidine kinase
MNLLDPFVFSALFCSAFTIIGAVFVYLRREIHPRAARILLIFLMLSIVWCAALALYGFSVLQVPAVPTLTRLHAFWFLSLPIAFLFLTRAVLEIQSPDRIWKGLSLLWFFGLAAVEIAGLSAPGWMPSSRSGLFSQEVPALALTVAGWGVFMGSCAWITMRTLRNAPLLYLRASYWVLVVGLVVAGDGFFILGFPAVGNLIRLAGTMLAVYVVAMPRLADISHILRRALSFALFSAVAILLYTFALALGLYLLRLAVADISPLMAGLLLAVVLALLLTPVLFRVHRAINQWVALKEHDPTYLLRQYSQSITNTLDLDLLATVAVGTASELLEVRRGFLFLVDPMKDSDGHGYYQLSGVRGMGDIKPEAGILPEKSPLAIYFREAFRPVLQSEIEFQTRFKEVSAAERAWLASLGAEVYVPIYTKQDWIGLLALGPKGSGAAYTPQDMALLSTMADQTAVALENTRLVEGLVRLNNDFRRAYEALDRANRHLERLDKTKSDFISIASHELRTPLTVISGSSQMLLDEKPLQEDAYYSQLLAKILDGAVRLHEIVERMLDMAAIDTRALHLETHPVSMQSLIRTVCTELDKMAQERKQTIEVLDLKGLPPVPADVVALHKVFYHLIINAIKFTPDGGKITISGRLVEANQADLPEGGIEVIVKDTGIGIDPRFQELIFVKFYKTGELALHSSGKSKFKGGGAGLGLAIARGIVEAHYGRIWVESPGYDEAQCPGSEFHVLLPLRPDFEAEHLHVETTPAA